MLFITIGPHDKPLPVPSIVEGGTKENSLCFTSGGLAEARHALEGSIDRLTAPAATHRSFDADRGHHTPR